jgi:hypothetical protein
LNGQDLQDYFSALFWQIAEKRIVTPAKAGIQEIKNNEFINMLDSGFRRNDWLGCFSDFFRNFLIL